MIKKPLILSVFLLQKIQQNVQNIGQRITRSRKGCQNNDDQAKESILVEALDLKISGIAICFEHYDAYYISFDDDIKSHSENDDTIAPKTQDKSIGMKEKIDILKLVFCDFSKEVSILDFRMFSKLIHLGLDVTITHNKIKYFDPKVASWILKPPEKETEEMNLAKLVMTFKPDLCGILNTLGPSSDRNSVAMNPNSKTVHNMAAARSRAIAECVLGKLLKSI